MIKMRNYIFIVLCLSFSFVQGQNKTKKQDNRPNIVLILSDDVGFEEVSDRLRLDVLFKFAQPEEEEGKGRVETNGDGDQDPEDCFLQGKPAESLNDVKEA